MSVHGAKATTSFFGTCLFSCASTRFFGFLLFLSDILCFYLLNLANPVRGLATGAKWGASWILGDLDLISSREMLAPPFLSA